MPVNPEKIKVELIEQIAASVGKRRGADAATFARTYYGGMAPEDFLAAGAGDLAGAVLSAWNFLKERPKNKPKVRVYNPTKSEHRWSSKHTVIEIVNDDMPFLVDSIVSAVNELDLTVHMLLHPIVWVKRNKSGKFAELGNAGTFGARAESLMHVEVDQLSDPKVQKGVVSALKSVLKDVRFAVEDWRPLLGRVDELIEELEDTPPKLPSEEVAEARAFLAWIRDNNFTFLGTRDYELERKGSKDYLRISSNNHGLGVLRENSEESIARHKRPLTPVLSRFARKKEVLIITKASSRSTVHRPVYMDYIGVRRFDARGNVTGERRFLGLFTSAAYNRVPADIPLLRRKVDTVLERSGFPRNSHNGKVMQAILDSYPRDELFQIDANNLFEIAQGIRHLEVRQRVRLFVRRDSYARFFSCFIYVHRERYNTLLRERFEKILLKAFNGSAIDFTVHLSEAAMARVHFIVHASTEPTSEIDIPAIEALLVKASRLWTDDLKAKLVDDLGEAAGNAMLRRYAQGFHAAYREAFPYTAAVADIRHMETVLGGDPIEMNLFKKSKSPANLVHLKVYSPGDSIALSDVLPRLENMGLRVLGEEPHEVSPIGDTHDTAWIHVFHMVSADGSAIDLGGTREIFHDAFRAIWLRQAEDDGFNALVLRAGLGWRDIVILRAYYKYLRQARIQFSQSYIEDALSSNAAAARLLVELFKARFDPAKKKGRDASAAKIRTKLLGVLDKIASLDEDRILRRCLNLIDCTLRTNYYQRAADGGPKSYVSFKLNSKEIDDLELPRPMVEIFVYSPRVEGVHLRFGKVARGGLRWSDRREDFRSEVLGLVKAQQVKNAVIVPVGSKGGFVVKQPPADRAAWLEEGIECYKTFIRGLLDLTDNLVGAKTIPPVDVVRLDGDDPYLVVAADKGTATFSDIANGVSLEYGHWLGDAFASGGSAGYDHKKMGITARGAWESVKRHFREFGHNTQTQDFTVVGCGDMSGDVFGNGMLLSKHIKLVGAFNHLNIFVDPDPDPAASWKERKRLFDLPRSSWTDYNAKLISKGGGIFPRSAKSISLSPQIRALFGLSANKVTPNELIRAMLLAEADLLWFGGIGTYIKARDETHAAVSDRANDAIRIDGRELRCKVLGEGANLGTTQRGRIEFAANGGRLNTDAIDNSAGVDCSDHEVNIKILFGDVMGRGKMTLKQRDRLLEKMTDEVAELVLWDNYRQTGALTMLQAQGSAMFDQQARYMRELERSGQLNRAIEFLPDDEEIADRQLAGTGLTRPELSVLLAYAKLELYSELVPSSLPDDPLLVDDLVRYFPKPLQKTYRPAIERHRLRREIIATYVTNSMVNRVGATFVHEMRRKTGMSHADIARAYATTRDVFELRDLWSRIDALDDKLVSDLQCDLLIEIGRLVERCTLWFLRNEKQPMDIARAAQAFGDGARALSGCLDDILPAEDRRYLRDQAALFSDRGAPHALAQRIADLEVLSSALDIVSIAGRCKATARDVGGVYFTVGLRFGLDWLRSSAAAATADTPWQKMAIGAIVEDLYGHQGELTTQMFVRAGKGKAKSGNGLIEAWIEHHRPGFDRVQGLIDDMRATGAVDVAMLTVANRQLRATLAG